MKKHKILYSKLNVPDIPINKKIHVTTDHQKLFYFENKKKIYVCDLNIIPFDNKPTCYTFVTDRSNDSNVTIYIEIDLCKLDNLLKDPIKFTDRKLFMKVINGCYQEVCKAYSSCVVMSMFEGALDDNKSLEISDDVKNSAEHCEFKYHDKNLEWMIHREQESQSCFYVNSDPIYTFDKYYVDVKKGRFISQNQFKKNQQDVRIRGGILVNNNDENWIYDFINLSITSTNSKKKADYMNTSATLILCNRHMCNRWKKKIEMINKKYNRNDKIILIEDKKTHDKVTYQDLSTSNYVIVNSSYIFGKQYKKTWEFYDQDDISIPDILDTMRCEYYANRKTCMKYSNPILSFFYWNRIILDSDASAELLINSTAQDILYTIESYYKWIHLDKIPDDNNNIISLVNYLSKHEHINFPIYDKDSKIVFLKNLLRLNNKETLNLDIEPIQSNEEIVDINLTPFEKQVYNYFIENSMDRRNLQFNTLLIDSINQLSMNVLSSKEIISEMKRHMKVDRAKILKNLKSANSDQEKLNLTKNSNLIDRKLGELCENNICDIQECNICYDNDDQGMVITKCNHSMCIDCALNTIKYSGNCPYCRSDIDLNTLYRLKDKCNYSGSKISELNKNIKCNGGKTVIFAKKPKQLSFINSNLKKNDKIIRCVGSSPGKMKKILSFNSSSKCIFLMSFEDKNLMSHMKGIDSVILYDQPNEFFDREKLLGLEVYNRDKVVNFKYLAYKNTSEQRAMRKYISGRQ